MTLSLRHALPTWVLVLTVLVPPCAMAQSGHGNPQSLPAWEQLTPTQRELLIAPLRERWNSSPEGRARIYSHAQRWQQMPPDQRQRAHHGMRRWERMGPEQRDEMRALYHQMRILDPDQREALRKQWHGMDAQQRRAWVLAHPPATE